MEQEVERRLERFYVYELILLIYLVYGRYKSFVMQSLKAFKSLKAYKFYYDGFVKIVWVHEFPTSETRLWILCFCAYVHHSSTCDAPLETYVTLNGDSGDVYSAQCTCVGVSVATCIEKFHKAVGLTF